MAAARAAEALRRAGLPWDEAGEGWTPADRADYERARRGEKAAGVRAPAQLRESLLSIWGESPEDAEIRRELGRLAS